MNRQSGSGPSSRPNSAATTPILLVALAFLLAMVTPASAATVLELKPTAAAVGERVTGKTLGAGMQGIISGRVTVFLAPSNRAADLATGPEDPRLVRFGVMTADQKDVGHFIGTVPSIAPGSYIAVAYCRGCAVGGGVFTIGEFEVAGAPLPSTGTSLVTFLFLGIALTAVGTVLARPWRTG